jgi:predicted ATPase/DNA-binding XRE family transcriptional regulator
VVSGQTPDSSAAVEGPEFGSLLRRHRRASGLSQEELARLAGLSVDAIAALERGRRRAPRPLTARMLADGLGLDEEARATFLDVAAGPSDPDLQCVLPPAPTNEMVGRAAELSDAVLRLTETPTRLLTLTGPGGIGKTRLAAALAQASADRLGAIACWVSLEPVVAGSSVASTTAAALGLRPMPGADPLDLIATSIAGRRTLIVLDNCEHVIEGCAAMTATLLGRCPELRVLATSRELLGVAGEAVQVVRPLALPPLDCPTERLIGSPAVRLFLARAAARGVDPTDNGLPDVAHVVRRLDGMPLAIELAAARLNVLTVRQVARELDESFGILRSGGRSGPARHRTMRAAISWSYDLLEPADQRCLAALSVFVGGWTLDAAEAVCADLTPDDGSDAPDVLELVGRLVDRSLVFVRRDGAEARYDIMSAIRDYALRQLEEQGRDDEVSERHARHYAEVLEAADSHLRASDQKAWLNLVDEELDNIRAAMNWSVEQSEPDLALRLAGSLWTFCYLRGHYSEGREWLEAALALGSGDHWEVRAKATLGAGMLAFLQCEYDLATRSIEDALSQYRAHDRLAETALCLQRLGSVSRERSDYDRADELHRDSQRLYAEVADDPGLAWARNHLGFVAWLRGDLATATEECGAALATFRDLGDGEGIAWSLISLGVVSLYRGDLGDAEGKLCESFAMSQELGYREGIAWALNQLGVVELRRGHNERAVHLLDESLAAHRDLGDRWRMASVIEALAEVATMRGRAEYAAFLVSAASAVRETIGAPVPPCEAVELDACVAALRKSLDRPTFTKAWEAGSKAPLHAVAEGYPVGA